MKNIFKAVYGFLLLGTCSILMLSTKIGKRWKKDLKEKYIKTPLRPRKSLAEEHSHTAEHSHTRAKLIRKKATTKPMIKNHSTPQIKKVKKQIEK